MLCKIEKTSFFWMFDPGVVGDGWIFSTLLFLKKKNFVKHPEEDYIEEPTHTTKGGS